MCSLDFGEIACNKYPVLLLLFYTSIYIEGVHHFWTETIWNKKNS